MPLIRGYYERKLNGTYKSSHVCDIPPMLNLSHFVAHSIRRAGVEVYIATKDNVYRRPDTAISIIAGIRLPTVPMSTYRGAIISLAVQFGRKLLSRDAALGSLVLDNDFAVNPVSWPGNAAYSFGLREPPSPREVGVMVGTHHAMQQYWAHMLPQYDREVLYFYCLGGKARAIENLYDMPSGSLEQSVATSIQTLMSNPMFALWALGTDTSMLVTSVSGRAVHRRITEADFVATAFCSVDRHQINDAAINMVATTYIRSQLNGGPRLNPVERMTYVPSIGWATEAERNAAEHETWDRWFYRTLNKYEWVDRDSRVVERGMTRPNHRLLSGTDIRCQPRIHDFPDDWKPTRGNKVTIERMKADGLW